MYVRVYVCVHVCVCVCVREVCIVCGIKMLFKGAKRV